MKDILIIICGLVIFLDLVFIWCCIKADKSDKEGE